ncbi:hypothetical protein ACO0K9_03775 [Undibacterium sp. Ji50W]|uniref:hypothetical protein n=1 Tax=Undibacterium sp. Ji50W TaxID=3413041 RepID=UPI003BF18086
MAALSNSVLMYASSVGRKGLELIAMLLLTVLTLTVVVLSIRKAYDLITVRFLIA